MRKRVSKTVSGASGYTTYYVGNYYEVRDPLSGSNVVTKYYYFGAQRVAMKVDSTTYYIRGDHLGSSSVVLDNAGAVYARRTYYPYGETRTQQGSALPTDFTFTGQRTDAGELMDYGAREYDIVHAQFIQPDSIVPDLFNPQILNRYSYVSNNPVRYTDPTGHMMDDGLDGGGGGGGPTTPTAPTTPTTPTTPPPPQTPPALPPAETPGEQSPNQEVCLFNICGEEAAGPLNKLAFGLDVMGALTDTAGSVVALGSTAIGTAIVPAGPGEIVGLGAGELAAQPFLAVSSGMAVASTAATLGADLFEGESVINPYHNGQFDPINGEYKIGPDPTNSLINTVIGMLDPEVFTNTAIAYHQVTGNDLHMVPTSSEIGAWMFSNWPSDMRWPDY